MKKKLLSLIITILCITAIVGTAGCRSSYAEASAQVKNSEELYDAIRDCMAHNETSCTIVYKGIDTKNIINIDNIMNNVCGLKSLKYEISQSIFSKTINLNMEYWDSDAIIYAYNNSDSSFLTERQKIMYDKYLGILNACVKPTNNDYENEMAVHDYLIDNITYDSNITSHFNAYEALTQGRAVCAGYAECFRTLMELQGIKCITISGTADGENHMWNAVCLDNEWYQVDVTWNDLDEVSALDKVHLYTYFNASEQDMSIDHTITSALPKDYVAGKRYIYANYECVPSIYDQATLNSLISKELRSHNNRIEFITKKELDIKTAINSAAVPCSYIINSVERTDCQFYTITCTYY